MPMPTKYRPEFCKQARKLCLLGATDQQLADFFEVAVPNLREWYTRHPEFGAAVRNGKIIADARMAQALYLNGMRGNVTAQIFWLKNRQSALWRDRHELTGANGEPIQHDVNDVSRIQAARHVAFAMAEGAELVKRAQQTGNAAAKKPAKEKA